jgi:copper homeostasis protein
MNFEVVLESIEELNEVNLPTIKSVELCAGLQLGGITPSYATTAYFCEHAVPEVHVMIRPRAGGFNYNEYEFKLMVEDIKFFAKLGVTGVVFGLLDENFKIEKEHTKRLYFAAKELGLQTTFHRAFDFTIDTECAIQFLVETGFDRLLTAGSKKTVDFGKEKLKKWSDNYGNEIQIIAGGGITFDNARQLKIAGLKTIHFNIKDAILSENSSMGYEYKLNLNKLVNILNL